MAKRKKKEEDFSWLDDTGSSDYTPVDRQAISGTIEGKAADLIQKVVDNAIRYKLVGEGTLTSEKGYQTKVTKSNDLTTLEIFMIFYGLFQDRGVKGFKSDKNAPNSPYQFKYGKMSEDGIANIKKSITQGRMKFSSKMVRKYSKIGLETKAKEETGDPIEKEAQRMAYLIKAFGIKTRPFFKEAFEDVFGPLQYDIMKAAKKQFIARLQFLNNQ